METTVRTKWRVLWASLLVATLGWAAARAAIVDLDAYVEYAILQNGGGAPLADGSWVYIIGSSNNIADPMAMVGAPPTNLIANSVSGDDVILGIVQIGYQAISNNSGTFYTTVQYDSDQVQYVYIRFFDATGTISGMVYWGTSTVFQLGVTLGVSTVQFDPDGSLIATNLNNFVVIPEPSTGNLIVLVAGMIWAMRAGMRKKGSKGPPDSGGRAV